MSEVEAEFNLSDKIPVGWTLEVISEAFVICNNLRFPISEEIRKTIIGKYPYYGPTKIQDYINEFRVDGKYALIGEDGDHFLKWRELPMTQLVEGKFNANNHVHLIRGENNLTEWFYYYFNHKELTPYLTRQGAGRYKLTKDSLSKIPCLIPPIIEQRKIVEILSCIEKNINITTQLIFTKEKNKKWLMQRLLTGKKRLKGFESVWKPERLGTFIIEREVKSDINNQFVILTSSRKGLFNQKDYFKKQVASEDNIGYKVMFNGDFTYRSMSDDNSFVFNRLDFLQKGLISPAYSVFYPNGIDGEFLKYFLNDYSFKKYINKEIQGGTRTAFRFSAMKEIKIDLPSLDEQVAIANIINTADREVKLLKEKVTKLNVQKKGLMQTLLTGKKRLI